MTSLSQTTYRGWNADGALISLGHAGEDSNSVAFLKMMEQKHFDGLLNGLVAAMNREWYAVSQEKVTGVHAT